jgi:hypothetical protein
MKHLLLTLSLLVMVAVSGRGEELPHFTPRELVVQADTVVWAVPLEGPALTCFRVLEVLKGNGVRAGDTLILGDLGRHDMQVYEEELPQGQKPRKRTVVEALLFLNPDRGNAMPHHWQPLLSGLRFLAEDGCVLVPQQLRNPGSYVLAVHHDLDWDLLVRELQADCAALRTLQAGKSLTRTGLRNRALLDWIRQHLTEFSNRGGWGELENDLFAWVLDGGSPEDAWEAVRLYAEVRHGAVPPLRTAVFASLRSRALLAEVASSDQCLQGDRVRALTVLGDRPTLWPEAAEEQRGRAQTLGEQEQASLIERLTPLLRWPSQALRAAAARALLSISCPADRARSRLETKAALTALTVAYRKEPPGPARDDLAEAVARIGGPIHWQTVSGNPRGLRGRLRDFERRGRQVSFWLQLETGGLRVFECPTLRLERLDSGDKPAETKEQPMPVTNLPKPWKEGWDGTSCLLVELPVGTLAPATWRVTVLGTAGKGKTLSKWTAEPRTFVILAAPGAPGARSTGWDGATGTVRFGD